jgi:hypothetical protein
LKLALNHLRGYLILTITQMPTTTLTAASATAAYKVMRSGSSITVPRQLETNRTLKAAAPVSKEK